MYEEESCIENPKSMLPNVYRNIDVFQSPKTGLESVIAFKSCIQVWTIIM